MRNRRSAREGRIVRIAVAACLLLATATCARSERIQYGVEPIEGGMKLRVSSLGSCGCVSFGNKTNEFPPDYDPKPGEKPPEGYPVMLIAAFRQAELGRLFLDAERSIRVRFDWAGPDGDDFYELSAVRRDPTTGQVVAAKITDVINVGEVTASSCSDQTCEFGALKMNRAATAPAGQDEAEISTRGVNFTKGDEVLEVSATRETCGCLVVRNISPDEDVFLRSTLHGSVVGGLELRRAGARPAAAQGTPPGGGQAAAATGSGPMYEDRYIGFDWAGDLAQDVYVINAYGVGQVATLEPGNASPAVPLEPPVPSKVVRSTAAATTPTVESRDRTLKIRTYVSVVGQMNGMQCSAGIDPAVRQNNAKTHLAAFMTDYSNFDPGLLQLMANYAAGFRGAPFPPIPPPPAIPEATFMEIQQRLDRLRSDEKSGADGALFVLANGVTIRCPFGDLNLDQAWQRSAQATTQPAAKPKD